MARKDVAKDTNACSWEVIPRLGRRIPLELRQVSYRPVAADRRPSRRYDESSSRTLPRELIFAHALASSEHVEAGGLGLALHSTKDEFISSYLISMRFEP